MIVIHEDILNKVLVVHFLPFFANQWAVQAAPVYQDKAGGRQRRSGFGDTVVENCPGHSSTLDESIIRMYLLSFLLK